MGSEEKFLKTQNLIIWPPFAEANLILTLSDDGWSAAIFR